MLVGAAQVDITPTGTPELSGYAGRVQPAAGVHDPILARALALQGGGGGRLLWLHADVLCFRNEFVDELKGALLARDGLAREEVVISATHTHSAPTTMPLINAGEPEPEFEAMLARRLLDVAAAALADMHEATAVAGETEAAVAIDRRARPSAHVDTRLSAIGWRREDGSWAAVLANLPMHNTMLNYDNRLISGDVAGAAARRLEQNLPGRPVVLWTNGAAANLNPPAKTTDFAKVEALGEQVARAAAAALDGARPLADERIRSASEIIPIALEDLATSRRYADQYLADLEGRNPKVKAIADFDDPTGYIRNRLVEGVRRWEALMDQQAASGTLPRTLPMELQAVEVGGRVLVCVGGEVFSRIRGEIAAGAGREVSIVGYANGYNGYLCPPEAVAEGGYEPDMSFIYGGIPRVAPGAHERVRDAAVELVGSLGAGE